MLQIYHTEIRYLIFWDSLAPTRISTECSFGISDHTIHVCICGLVHWHVLLKCGVLALVLYWRR